MLCDSIYVKYPQQTNRRRQGAGLWLPRAGGWGVCGTAANGHEVSLGEGDGGLQLHGGIGCTTLWICYGM